MLPKVTIRQVVFDALDEHLGFDAASQMIADLYHELPDLPASRRRDRNEDEPDVFYYRVVRPALGFWRTLDFAVNDGWEVDCFHVLGVIPIRGGRAF